MARGKRARLVQPGPQDRTTRREPVAIPARCTIGEREPEEVLITDLGKHGCRIHTGAVGVTKAERLLLQLDDHAPVRGTLKWTKGGMLGVRFTRPLGDRRLRSLCAEQSAGNVVPLRR